MTKVFIGDRLCEGDSASLSVLGRGFAFGFGVFETLKFLEGRPCFWEEHIARLQQALLATGIACEIDSEILLARTLTLLEAESVESGIFKIVCLEDIPEPQVSIFVRSRGLDDAVEPVSLVASEVVKASKALTSCYKTLNYMESIIALEVARGKGFGECVFRNEHKQLTECAVANLFWVEGGVLKTPELSCGLLDGIVRQKVLEIATRNGTPVDVGKFEEADLLQADEVFLTSSGKGPRSASSYTTLVGQTKRYSSVLVEKIQKEFRELELESTKRLSR